MILGLSITTPFGFILSQLFISSLVWLVSEKIIYKIEELLYNEDLSPRIPVITKVVHETVSCAYCLGFWAGSVFGVVLFGLHDLPAIIYFGLIAGLCSLSITSLLSR